MCADLEPLHLLHEGHQIQPRVSEDAAHPVSTRTLASQSRKSGRSRDES